MEHDPLNSGDPLWGDPPTGGTGSLGSWYALIPNQIIRSRTWSCTSNFQCSTEGTVKVSIARNGATNTFNTGAVTGGSDFLTTDAAHGLSTGDSVWYSKNGGSVDVGLSEVATYFVNSLSATTLSLHGSKSQAESDINRIDINASGSETHSLTTSGIVLATGYYRGEAEVTL